MIDFSVSFIAFSLIVALVSVQAQVIMTGYSMGNIYQNSDCTNDNIIGVAYQALGTCVKNNEGSESFTYGYEGDSTNGKLIKYTYNGATCSGAYTTSDYITWANSCTGQNVGNPVTTSTMNCWSTDGVVNYRTIDNSVCSNPQASAPFSCEAYYMNACRQLPESTYSSLLTCGENSLYYDDIAFQGGQDSGCASTSVASSQVYYGCSTNSSALALALWNGYTCGTPVASSSCNCGDDDYKKDTFDVTSANLALTLITGILVGVVLYMQLKGRPMAGGSNSSNF